MNNSISGPTGSVGPIGITGPVGQSGVRSIRTKIWNRIIKIKKLKRIWETIRVI